jgi:phospholipid/cholesterol/gamma-HCH transport system substrate-binding protein
MRPRSGRPLLVGLAAAVTVACSACSISLQSLPKPGTQTGPSYQLHATFANVLNLPTNAQVREGSALIGQVGSINTRDFRAQVVLNIRSGVRLPVGSTAQVRFDTPLGDEFVVVQVPPGPSTGPFLANGAVLGEEQTSTAPSVEDTLAALGTVLNGGGLNQLQTIIDELNKTFDGNQPQIRSLLQDITASTVSLSTHASDIDTALASFGHLADVLNSGRTTITQAIDAIAPGVSVLASENSDFSNLFTQLTNLSTVANSVISQTTQSSVNDAKQLLPLLNQLVGVESQLGPALTDIAKFESTTPKVAPGNYLQVSVTATANLNSAPCMVGSCSGNTTGAAVSALLQGGLP